MRAGARLRDLAVIEQAHKVLAGHVQDVGGFLGGQKLVDRHEAHGIATRQHLGGSHENLLDGIGQDAAGSFGINDPGALVQDAHERSSARLLVGCQLVESLTRQHRGMEEKLATTGEELGQVRCRAEVEAGRAKTLAAETTACAPS